MASNGENLMRIGYPCINRGIGCSSGRTFRLASYSDELLATTVEGNLQCLSRIIDFNAQHGLLFFRITSDLVPFASHPICTVKWQANFAPKLAEIGTKIKAHGMRISMHPDQFVLINALDPRIVQSSIAELAYHAQVLDLLGLDLSAKIQVHVGGVYGDKPASVARFVARFRELDVAIRSRLVIENDDRSYTLRDCLQVHADTGIPVLFDTLHHQARSSGEPIQEAFLLFTRTWTGEDGLPLVDYSSQKAGGRLGQHATTIDVEDLRQFLADTHAFDFDLMLEIKDKEKSALLAMQVAATDPRLRGLDSLREQMPVQ
jgi:UV DNA damage endonuclease